MAARVIVTSNGSGVPGAYELECDLGAGVAANLGDGGFHTHISGVFVVDLGDEVAGLKARLVGRSIGDGRDDGENIIFNANFGANPGELSGEIIGELLG